MEEDPQRHRRRNTLPSSVVIPVKFELVSTGKPRRSPSVPNGHTHNHPPSSASSASSDGANSEQVSFKFCSPMYTSLKDLLPSSSSLLSPTPVAASTAATTAAASTSTSGGCEISIRNRLVKQAAWAYLQPMSSSPTASGPRLCTYFSLHFLRQFFSSVKRSFVDLAARASSCLADALWLILCR